MAVVRVNYFNYPIWALIVYSPLLRLQNAESYLKTHKLPFKGSWEFEVW